MSSLPAASTLLQAWPFTKLCTCYPQPSGARIHLRLGHVMSQHASRRAYVRKRVRASADVATERQAQQQQPSQLQSTSQIHGNVATSAADLQQQDAGASSLSNSNQSTKLLDPQSYQGTSDKARRKELVEYLSSIPESEMTPEMLRRWRISKANKGKQAWNFGRRHSPETIAKITQRTQAAMLRPEVLQKVRDHHPHASRIATPEMRAKMSKAITANHQRRTQARIAAMNKHQQPPPAEESVTPALETTVLLKQQQQSVTSASPSHATSSKSAIHKQQNALGLHPAPSDRLKLTEGVHGSINSTTAQPGSRKRRTASAQAPLHVHSANGVLDNVEAVSSAAAEATTLAPTAVPAAEATALPDATATAAEGTVPPDATEAAGRGTALSVIPIAAAEAAALVDAAAAAAAAPATEATALPDTTATVAEDIALAHATETVAEATALPAICTTATEATAVLDAAAADATTLADAAATTAKAAVSEAETAASEATTSADTTAAGEQTGIDSSQDKPRQAKSKKRSEEHKRNISLAVRKKWAEPGYRDKVLGGMRTEVTQTQRVSSYKASVMRKTLEGRGKLHEARAKQDQLNAARQTVEALQLAVEAGQQQAEALRGDPAGFARQQEVLNTAQQLVARVQAQVAAMEASTPSLEEVAAELGARPSTEQLPLRKEEKADADEALGGEQPDPESDGVSTSALKAIAAKHWSAAASTDHSDVVDVTSASRALHASQWQPHQTQGNGDSFHVTGDSVQDTRRLQAV